MSKEIREYIEHRNRQFGKFGLLYNGTHIKYGAYVSYYGTGMSYWPYFCSIYIPEGLRGHNLYETVYNEIGMTVATLEECDMLGYLQKKRFNYAVFYHSKAYKLIENVYGTDCAERSKVPYMNHIDEGGTILEAGDASQEVKDAYYLHPIFQSDAYNDKHFDYSGISAKALRLAIEYEDTANSYLSTMERKDFVGFPNPDVKAMLIADKVQNYKDFLLYHKDTHPRSEELDFYFNEWFDILDIDYNHYVRWIDDSMIKYKELPDARKFG